MAGTTVHHEAEAWVVKVGLPTIYPGVRFSGSKRKLKWDGSFAFDAVSDDGTIVVSISTSAARTASGKLATAKFQKLKSDALYLLNLKHDARRVMAFTEMSMCEYFQAAASAGRFPPNIDLVHVPLPDNLNARVLASRDIASRETSPAKASDRAL